MEWTKEQEAKALEIDWKHAKRNIPGLRRWKIMTNNKADHAFWRIVRHYAEIVPLTIAMDCAHNEMRVLYNMVFDKESKEWRAI